MIKYILASLVIWFGLIGLARAETQVLDNHLFAQLPVQREGRIEPLDSFARYYFDQFYSGAVGRQAPIAWLAELLFTPEQAYARKTFKVTQAELLHALGLPDRSDHLYTYVEIATAFDAHADMLKTLLSADPKTITDPAQLHLLGLYQSVLTYIDISRTFAIVLPDFVIQDPALAQAMQVEVGQSVSYLDMIPHQGTYARLAEKQLKQLGDETPTAQQQNLLQVGLQLEHIEKDNRSRIMQIVPSAWSVEQTHWLSPWMVLAAGQGSPQTAKLMTLWQTMATAYRTQDQALWDATSRSLLQNAQEIAGHTVRPAALKAEYIYNLTHLFVLSSLCYVGTLVLLAFSTRKATLKRTACWLLVTGLLFHTAGLTLRIFILARPPVGTLYESILFVAWVVVIGGLLVDVRQRSGLGVMIGGFAGLALQSLAPLFGQSGNTMEPLVAVLNTNFWLATHVLAITIGYGCCLVTGLLAHLYIVQKIRDPLAHQPLAALSRAVLAAALIALCFATIGTILGGIWADQSWGRFWGWDPKENGALLIVLWLLFILHGRLSGLLHTDHFICSAAGTIIVVALSWFGVNLLNVGLHSYGFTSGIAFYLTMFVLGELALLGGGYVLLKRRQKAVS